MTSKMSDAEGDRVASVMTQFTRSVAFLVDVPPEPSTALPDDLRDAGHDEIAKVLEDLWQLEEAARVVLTEASSKPGSRAATAASDSKTEPKARGRGAKGSRFDSRWAHSEAKGDGASMSPEALRSKLSDASRKLIRTVGLDTDSEPREMFRRAKADYEISTGLNMFFYVCSNLERILVNRLGVGTTSKHGVRTTGRSPAAVAKEIAHREASLGALETDRRMLEMELITERKRNGQEVGALNDEIQLLKTRLDDVQLRAKNDSEKLAKDSTDLRNAHSTDHGARSTKLKADLAEAEKDLLDQQEKHSKAEGLLKKKCNQYRREIDNKIEEFDEKMTEIDAEMQKEKRDLNAIRKKLKVLQEYFAIIDKDLISKADERRAYNMMKDMRDKEKWIKETSAAQIIQRSIWAVILSFRPPPPAKKGKKGKKK